MRELRRRRVRGELGVQRHRRAPLTVLLCRRQRRQMAVERPQAQVLVLQRLQQLRREMVLELGEVLER